MPSWGRQRCERASSRHRDWIGIDERSAADQFNPTRASRSVVRAKQSLGSARCRDGERLLLAEQRHSVHGFDWVANSPISRPRLFVDARSAVDRAYVRLERRRNRAAPAAPAASPPETHIARLRCRKAGDAKDAVYGKPDALRRECVSPVAPVPCRRAASIRASRSPPTARPARPRTPPSCSTRESSCCRSCRSASR